MTPREYIQNIKKAELQRQKDLEFHKRLLRQNFLTSTLKIMYVHQRIKDNKIMSCTFIRDPNNRILIDYRLENHQRRTTFVDQLYNLGFIEWKYIARFMKGLVDKKMKEEIMSELILLVEVAHDLGKLDDFEYGVFCVSHNIKKHNRPVGLATQKVHEGLIFKENVYIRKRHE